MRDVVIIGAGPNGLVAAAVLAKSGLKPLVLEGTDRVGGCALTGELAPGFRCPTLAHRAALDPSIVRELELERHGLRILRPAALVFAPASDGRALSLWSDPSRAALAISAFSSRDAWRYPEFLASVASISRVLRRIVATAPPFIDAPRVPDVLQLIGTARQFRRLKKVDAYRLLRWLSMPVADLAREWFDSEPLRAVVAAAGLLGAHLGPRSAGSAAILLLLAAGEGQPVAPGWTVRGGPGKLAEALANAARGFGADIRTRAAVRRILVEDGAATGVVLADGEEITAKLVVSSADPRRTLAGLVDPVNLSPESLHRVRHIRMRGTLAKVNYAVRSLPRFIGLDRLAESERHEALTGCVRLGAGLDDLERAFDAAKYGRYSENPWIELVIPSLADPDLAPAGCHVVSAYVQYAPYHLRETTWDAERDRFGDVVTRTIETMAPGFGASVLARQIITPLDLERTYGLTGGHIFHGELALDQMFVARPVLGWPAYHTPIRNLFLCGSGAHPGTGLDGRSGRLAAREILRHT
jgi:phytoene dehydrogenase-like protein